MIISLFILIPFTIATVCLFLKYVPSKQNNKMMQVVNFAIVVIGLLLCGTVSLRFYIVMAGGVDEGWWPILSVLCSLIIFPITLIVGGLIRNFFIFPSPKVTNGK